MKLEKEQNQTPQQEHENQAKHMQESKQDLEQEIEGLQQLNTQLGRKYNQISLLRLLSFLILAAGLVFAFAASAWWGWLAAGIGAAGFFYLLVRHEAIVKRQKYTEFRIQVLNRRKARFAGEWQSLPDTGEDFLTEENYVAKDLDLFGKHSLYQMLCVAHTWTGKKRLAEVLLCAEQADIHGQEITARQQAIQELTAHKDFRIHYEALALEQESGSYRKTETVEQKNRRDSLSAMEDEVEAAQQDITRDKSQDKVLSVLAVVWLVLMLAAAIGAVARWWPIGVVLGMYFVGLLLSWALSGYCSQKMEDIYENREVLQSNLYLLEALAQESFQSELLLELQHCVTGTNQRNVLQGMKELERMLAVYHFRYNPILHYLLNGIFLYDIHLARWAVLWKQNYGKVMQESIEVLGEVEMLSSFALLAELRPVSYPVIHENMKTPYLHMTQGFHPLLPLEQAVANSIHLEAKPTVITGSNMSGKTTFLRTIGMNVILAYAGAPVCADAMELSVMRVFTSMRIADDVNHGISTFYAEILRIKEMAVYGTKEQAMLCLIDEIFKGTNSADRIVGAEAVIHKLTQPHIIAMISTHDFELCRLAENYHFEEYYDAEGIQFDYQLREGMCQTTNALHLLRLAGLAE